MSSLIPKKRQHLQARDLIRCGRWSDAGGKSIETRSWICRLAVLILLVVSPALVRTQEKTTSIREVLRDVDGNSVPDRLGETFTVSGVLISDPVNLRPAGRDANDYAALVNVQDGTGGIVLFNQFKSNGHLLAGFKRGDKVTAHGTLAQYNGMEELMLTDIIPRGSANLPAPRDVKAIDLQSERFSSQLVRLTGELNATPDLLQNRQGVTLSDSSGEIQVYISDRFFSYPQFVARLMQGGKAEVVGIASQFCKDPPFNTGYRLVPRDPADFKLTPIPPYRLIILSAVVLTLLAVSGYLWLRRRRAEQHARELTLLTENLKRSEEALRQSEERFRKVFEDGPVGIVLGNSNFRILKANRALCQMLGYTEAELAELSIQDITYVEDVERTLDLERKLFRGELSDYQHEKRYVTKDRRVIWGNRTSSLVRGGDGNPLYALGIVEDISRRKEAEQILEKSERRFRSLIEQSSDCISLINSDGVVLYDAEPATLRNLGYNSTELVGRNVFDLMHPDDVPLTRSLLAELLQTQGRKITAQYRLRHKDGSWHWFEATGTNLLDEPSVQAVVINARDITERKLGEQNLRLSEERFSKAFLASPIAISIATLTEGRFIDVNDSFLHLMGYSRDEVIGRSALELGLWISTDDRAYFAQRIREDGSLRNHECSFRTKSGEIREGLGAAELIDLKGERCILTLILDITDRKRFEVTLAKARDEALESVRVKSEFLANISHEVRTPLNGIIGMTVLLQDTPVSPQQSQFVNTIQTSADALLTIINDILDFSKIEAGKLQFETLDFDLRSTIENTVELLADQAQTKRIELVSTLHDDVPTLLRGDPGRLRQVITNLVINGIKFTDKGEVALRVARESESATHVTVCFTVADTGIGIAPDALPYLFQAFSQADGSTTRKYGGTGLGLAISKQLVELMGGQIGVESTPGQGSTFWFTAQFEKQKETSDFSRDTSSLAQQRVLVVDDNETNRNILIHMSESFGMRPTGMANGRDALEILKKEATTSDPFKLAILDMQMPEMDGLTLARNIKADPALSETRLLIMTSLGLRSDTAVLRAAGVGAFLVKPVKQGQLLDCVISVMNATAPSETRFWHQRKDTSEVPQKSGLLKLPPLHLLVAEDNAINQKVAIGLLEKLGYRAVAVASGKEALDALELVPYDIVFMDCQLPELDGYKTTMEIRRREASQNNGVHRRAYIIAMTSYAVNGAREKCLAAGMDDYISKPVHLEDLEAVLARGLSGVVSGRSSAENNGAPALDKSAIAVLRQLRQPGKPDPFSELVDIFVRETPGRLREMRVAAARYDAGILAASAHALRGCAGSIGAMQLARLCEEMEQNAERRALQVATRLLKEIEIEFDRVCIMLKIEQEKSEELV